MKGTQKVPTFVKAVNYDYFYNFIVKDTQGNVLKAGLGGPCPKWCGNPAIEETKKMQQNGKAKNSKLLNLAD